MQGVNHGKKKPLRYDWGPWQILFITALELGFQGEPGELADPKVSIDWVIKLINKRIIGKGANTLDQIADIYNSGSFEDDIVPAQYVEGLAETYNDLTPNWLKLRICINDPHRS